MAKTKTPSSGPKKETSTPSTKSGSAESKVSKGIRKAGEILQSPVVRNMVAAGIETAVATRNAKTSRRKGAQEESAGAIIESGVVAVATQAAQRIAATEPAQPSGADAAAKRAPGGKQGASKPKAPAKSGARSTSGQAESKATASASGKAGTSGTKKASSPSKTGTKSAGKTGSKAASKTASQGAAGNSKSASKAPAQSKARTKKTASKKPS